MCRAATDSENKPLDNFSSAWRVCDFGVKLNTVPRLIIVSNRCKGSRGSMADDMEVGRDFEELISVGHPDL